MYIQRFIIAAIIVPLAVAAPIANAASENNKQDGATSTSNLRPRQYPYLLWDFLAPLGLEPVVDGINSAVVGTGLKQ